MLVGMGTVFVFLSLLVGVTALMSRLVLRWQPVPAPPTEPTGADVERQREVAAIVAALDLHRRRRAGRGS